MILLTPWFRGIWDHHVSTYSNEGVMDLYEGILQKLRDQGNWIAIDTDDTYGIIEAWIEAGLPFPEALARIDLIYWIDRRSVRPFRYYAKRWGWGEKRARLLFTSMGLMGHDKGIPKARNRRVKGTRFAQNSTDSTMSGTVEESGGHREATVAAHYIQTQKPEEKKEEYARKEIAIVLKSEVFIEIPTDTVGEVVPVTIAKIREYSQTYPGVDVEQELRAIRQWIIDNPSQPKAETFRFINGWLNRSFNEMQKSRRRDEGKQRKNNVRQTARRPGSDYEVRRQYANSPLEEQDFRDLAHSLRAVEENPWGYDQ